MVRKTQCCHKYNYFITVYTYILFDFFFTAPKLFSVAFNFVKRFLDEYTMSKIKIFKTGSDKWKEPLFSHVDPNIFPKCFGGNYVDENGDPECKSKVGELKMGSHM